MKISDIKSVSIYPAIGISRVGNSPDEYFIGPTIPGQPATDSDDFRDKKGRIKRQAAKFFIYALDGKGNILGELSEKDGVKIDWRAQVANKKSGWYNFDLALDIPAAMGKYNTLGIATPDGDPILSRRRNGNFQGKDRNFLMIEGGEQKISGKNKKGKNYRFEGKIGSKQTSVYLGELRTDEDGRLLFLGGLGKSATFNNAKLTTFANNDGWHDDTSDGPVDATVTLPNGKKLEAEGAWVATAPPNYAVGVEAITTGYDLLRDVAYREDEAREPKEPSFYKDIFPILKHFALNQWVNAGMSRDYGWGSGYDFENPEILQRLADKTDASRPFRQTIFESLRNPDFKKPESDAWPPVYGDGVAFNVNANDPRNWYAVTQLQYDVLAKWAKGKFITDECPEIPTWETMDPAEQANGLTEAALSETLGGPFHPGCEFTWPMRNAEMYQKKKPFRIRRRKNAKDDYGVAIDHDIAFAKGGPLDGSAPGDLTKWMAVPWQTDTSSCLSAYKSFAGEYLPTFWPARMPNDVLTEESYDTIQNKGLKEKKIKAFSPASRKKWLRGFIYDDEGNTLDKEKDFGITKFTNEWFDVGIVLKKPLDADPKLFPKEVWVETGRNVTEKKSLTAQAESEERPKWIDQNPREHR